MKKIIFILLTALFLSCSSDSATEQNNPTNNDNLVGKWKLTKEVYYNTTLSTSQTRLADACEDLSYNKYNVDGTFTLVSYDANGSGGCDLIPSTLEYANWLKLSPTTYKFTSKFTGETEETYNETISFEDNNNTLIVHENQSGSYNGQPYNNSSAFYTKIN